MQFSIFNFQFSKPIRQTADLIRNPCLAGRQAQSAIRNPGEAGFTLLELIVASGIFASVMLVGLAVISSSSNVESYTRVQREVGQTGRFALETIARDVRSANGIFTVADPTTITTPPLQIVDGGLDTTGEWTGTVLQTATTLVSAAGQTTSEIHRYRVSQTGTHRYLELLVCADKDCLQVHQTARITPDTIEVNGLDFHGLPPTTDLTHQEPFVRINLRLQTRSTGGRAADVASQNVETVVTARNIHF